MTRRLTIAIVGVVAGALLLAGVGTLVLVRLSAVRETRDELVRQSEGLAPVVDSVARAERVAARQATRRPVLGAIQRAFRLQGVDVVALRDVQSSGGDLPVGVRLSSSDVDRVAAGETVAGNRGRLVFVAAPVTRPAGTSVVVLTRDAGSGLRSGGWWFALAAVVALLAAVAVASSLGARLTRPVRDADDAARRIAAGDLSARVAPARTGDELEALGASINTMAEELERSRALERTFLLSVSHDLRTPLTSIRGFAEAIADGAAPDHEKAATVIAAESRRLERLVGDLLDLARLDAHRFSLDVRDIDVAEVVAETAEGFRPAAEGAGLSLDVDVAAARGRADPDRLAQVVANLVENAFKFASSRIGVGCQAEADGVRLWVDDDGPGIAPDERDRVFERLYTSSREPARQGTGSGLGLAIVKELCDAMGARVGVEPQASGTRITVRVSPSDRPSERVSS